MAGDMTGDGAVAVAGNSGDMAAGLGRESASESAPESESLAPAGMRECEYAPNDSVNTTTPALYVTVYEYLYPPTQRLQGTNAV